MCMRLYVNIQFKLGRVSLFTILSKASITQKLVKQAQRYPKVQASQRIFVLILFDHGYREKVVMQAYC